MVREKTALTARLLATLSPSDALLDWLEAYRIDGATYEALASEAGAGGSATVTFCGDEPMLWRDAADERYAVIARFNLGQAYYAIPHNAKPPGIATVSVVIARRRSRCAGPRARSARM
jgi:hypothetical protein